jgi:hypothetical protein
MAFIVIICVQMAITAAAGAGFTDPIDLLRAELI